jgi:hypothetical protein
MLTTLDSPLKKAPQIDERVLSLVILQSPGP